MLAPVCDALVTMPPRQGIAIVLGTRPELVKLAQVTRLLGGAARVIHTGQHYDGGLSGQFIDEFGLPTPTFLRGVGGQARAAQIGRALTHLDAEFSAAPPQVVVVQGDTNSALAGALAANSRGIPLLHVEAGLRSRDRAMPEEHNRVLIDHLADVLCAPTVGNQRNLIAEGIPAHRVVVTGNTVVEAVTTWLAGPRARARLLARHGLADGRYVLATVHRPENTDDPATLAALLTELSGLAADGVPVVLPLHPRTWQRARAAGLSRLLARVRVCAPLGHAEFLALANHAGLLISDSGGVQEEATVLGRPLVVVRRSTERPEALTDFAELVSPGPDVGAMARKLLAAGPELSRRLRDAPCPFGDGLASWRITRLLARIAGARPRHAAA